MENNTKPMTVKDILEDVRKILGDIKVPASQIEEIGIPIARSINGIQACLDAFDREEQAKQDEPEIKIEPGEGSNDA